MVDKNIPAGWYPAEHRPGELRYWDGAKWTKHRTPSSPVPAIAAPSAVEPNKVARLHELLALRESAGLTDDEFNVLEAEVLGEQVGDAQTAAPEQRVPGPGPKAPQVVKPPTAREADAAHLEASVQPLLVHLNKTPIYSRAEAARAMAAGSWRSNVLTPVFRDRMLVVSGTAWTRVESNSDGRWSPAESGELNVREAERPLAEIADDLVVALNHAPPRGADDILTAVFDIRWLGLITNDVPGWTQFDKTTVLTLKRGVGGLGVGYSTQSGKWEVRRQSSAQPVQRPSVATYSVPRRTPGTGQRYATPPRTNGFAIASLVLGLVGGSLLAIVFGHVARGQISRSGGSEKGEGMALAGLILGYAWLVLLVIIFVTLASATSSYQ